MSTDARATTGPSTLHVACMPFPTPQGTQAIVGMMVRALRQQGHQAHLLTYAHGQPDPHTAMDVEPRRLPDWPRVRATRSGPSLGKLALDLRMVAALRAERARTGAQLLVAHNVEAAWACAAAGVAPFVYFAHTSMREELPYYLPRSMHLLSRAAGDALDRGACIRAASVFALTPALAMRLSPLHPRVERVLPPFEMPAHAPPSRTAARMRVGLPQGAPIALYAGNLDAYQGIELLLGALERAPAEWYLLVATASAPAPLRALAAAHGVAGRVVFAPLGTEHDRAVAHAAADVALVPRLASGGLPIKLLEALARGVPAVANQRALAGLPLADEAHMLTVVDDDSPEALAHGMERLRARLAGLTPAHGGEAALAAAGITAAAFVPTFQQASARALDGVNP
ncbi:MAG: glycosyltransferase family 4 protein [Sandaracinaceae bacterium]|nr:glycosyltransferase family 4 protein [Sandaracinaceae bacterium]